MTSPKYKVTWKTFVLPLIGLAAFFVYLYLFNVDIREIIAKMQNIRIDFYVMAAIASLLDVLFFTVAWHFLMRFLAVRISLFRESLFVWVGIFVDTLIPAESVSGEITKIYLVDREQNGAAGKATASIVAQRLIGMSINIVTLIVGAILLLAENLLYGMMLGLVVFLIVVTFVFLVLILFLCRKEKWTLEIVDSVTKFAEWISRGRWKLTKLREEAMEATRAFHVAIKDYGHAPGTVLLASLFSAASWGFSLVILYLTFLSLGYSQISWSAILVTSAIFIAIKSIPMGIPFEIGFPEVALTTLFGIFGVPWNVSATATILMRLLTLWVRFFIGFGAQQWLGIKTITAGSNEQTSPTEKV